MKKSYIILGIILLTALFVFIPNGAAGDLADYCDEQCYDEACYAACGMEPDPAECVTVRDDPNTPEDEFYVSPGCDALIAYQECCSKCDGAWEDCWNECMSKGAISDKEMIITVSTHKNIYSPGETVIVQGSVKDAKGNAIPGVSLAIEIEGTGISAIAGTMQDVTYYSGPLDLPKDLSEGTYTVKVTASKTGYPDVSTTTSFTVGEVKIEVEGNYTGVAADGISELHFIAEFPKEATNPQFYCGPVEDIPQPNCELVKLVSKQPGKMEFNFKPREQIKDPHKVRVVVTVDMPDGQLSAYKDIQVVRPPVVLIHGIWSNRVSMMPLRRSLIDSGEYPAGHTLVVDYGTSPKKSNQDLRKSAESLAAGVDRTLQKLEEEGIKVSRVDIVAHSMGGLIARYYMFFGYMDSNGQVIGPGQAAKVRKLITLDTPHAGSHVADWYVDFMTHRYVECGTDRAKFDINKVTEHELEWFLNLIRVKESLPSDGLEFGEAVKQLQTPGRPGSIIDELLRGQSNAYPSGAHVRYYLIAGDVPLLATWKWLIVLVVMNEYPYREMYFTGETLTSYKGCTSVGLEDCGEYMGQESAASPVRTVVRDMVSEFRDNVGQESTDGIVTVNSQLDSTRAANGRSTFHSNHLSITNNTQAYDMVMRYLTDDQVRSSGTTVISKSPGHLHVYDGEGRHVGIDPNGQPDIGINGAEYMPFSDMTGEHEYIWVPETDGIRVEFLADEEGTVGLDISQGSDDGLHWFSYEDIEVKYGSKVSIQLHPTTPTGQIVHSNGTTENILPAYSEIPTNRPPTASFALMPENPEVGDYIVVVSTSSDPDGDMLAHSWYLDGAYIWELDDLSSWEWEDAEAGEYTVTLMVEDGKDGIDQYTMAVTVVGDGEDVGTKGKR